MLRQRGRERYFLTKTVQLHPDFSNYLIRDSSVVCYQGPLEIQGPVTSVDQPPLPAGVVFQGLLACLMLKSLTDTSV